ncbi:MAG TPA: DMT family transporter [Candidatus Salinicoccus stercoripullorum]|uniref:DMT family transporter n=1 Tax=Candidatus Salinicoccus stercoripullorum TaxID=2838756 RepID=A0A9D1QIG9_9STAP|nr:DMT family transporter [Candidatus Salinicoccus stercoripullorum]
MIMLIILGAIAGSLIPVQTSINNRLAVFTRSVFLSSFYSFLVGTLMLVLFNLFANPEKLSPSYMMDQDISYIWFVGGLMGVIYLTGNVLLLPKIGAALTVIMTVAGQMVIGLLIDTFGWFDADIQPINIFRVLGIIIMIAGIIFMNYKKKSARQAEESSNIWLAFGLFTGAMPPIQTAVNSALRHEVDSFFFASLVSFIVGAAALLILSLIIARHIRFVTYDHTIGSIRPWHFIGGALGALYVTTNIVLMPHLGATLTLMTVIFGQMLMGLLIDHFGLLGIHKNPIDTRRITGVIMILSGIVLLQMF